MAVAVDRRRHERLAEDLYEAQLPPGLRVLVLPRPGFAKKYATFATRYGSVDNRFRLKGEKDWVEVPDGIAHFLEHQLFAQEYGDAFERFSELGAEANAFTTFTSTTYLFSTTDAFEENLEVLLDFVQTPHFTDQGTEKEKGIIQQEIRMYQDNPNWRLGQNLREALFQRHPFRIDIAGTVESVGAITTELLETCYRTFYHPSNMVLSVVGDVDPEGVVEQVAADLAKRGYEDQPEIERSFPEEPEAVARQRVEAEMAVSRPLFVLGFKERHHPADGRELVEREVATDILHELLFGPSSDIYNRLYEEGLVDGTFSSSYYGEKDFGMSRLGGATDEPDRLYEELLGAVEEARQRGVKAEDFERVRRKLYGDFISHFDSPETLAYILNATYFHDTSIFAYLEAIESITLEEVNRRLARHFDPSSHAVSIVRPTG